MSRLGLDHVLILHDDLERARRSAETLGFQTTPVCAHSPHMGTANSTIVMPDRSTYIELLGIVNPTAHNRAMRDALASRGNHIFGLAMRGNAREAHARLSTLGAADGDVIDFSRPVELPQGRREASFSIVQMKPGTVPGLYGIICEHHTLDVVWREDRLGHPNGAQAVSDLIGEAPDLDAVGSAWGALLEGETTRTSDTLEARTATARVRYNAPLAARKMLDIMPGDEDEPRMLALTIAVGSIDKTKAWFDKTGIGYRQEEGLLRLDRHDLGCVLLFIEAGRRPQR